MREKIWLVAGGTYGHINGALVIGDKLDPGKWDVLYISGTRPIDFKVLKDKNVWHLNGQPLLGRTPWTFIKNIFLNTLVFFKVCLRVLTQRPQRVLGCGGYICGPTLFAAKLFGVPVYLLEQNSVMGLTNKFLAPISKIIFISMKPTIGLKNKYESKTIFSGNPVRSSIQKSKRREQIDRLRVLVFGGSLGAEEINNYIKKIVEKNDGLKLDIIHQSGGGKKQEIHTSSSVHYQQLEYLDNIPENYEWCDCIIARSGASTVAELRVLQKPCFLIPALYHKDKHQVHNAKSLKEEIEIVQILNSREEEKAVAEIEDFFQKVLRGEMQSSKSIDSSQRSEEIIISELAAK
ncbi:MAG: UDP-N-acetylglucosamine--N-acetylmuramyl-(pentapeptide) pyrophosphoryl-undecaprenol N-acetylglucosamine transferase [Halobacteriovoraceae bacterium]|nr:UDP-N-acetylglucosamine--N-acetylmuramyl-(pentapeptide) pyrophosphoryl-undecaprenol N-acetylglucosamine transferase [Halobacteriovoraceae bacterium]